MGKDDLASLALVADIGRRQGLACGLAAAVDLDVAALGVGRQAIGHGTARQLLPGRPRPCLFLASNLGDFRRADVLHHAPESRARLDGGKLLVIAQQDDFCPGLLGGFQHAAKLAAADHARLVDHENIAGSELVLSVLPRKFKAGERAAFDAAARLQFVGRLASQGSAAHVEALGLPRLAGDLHGERFARAGVADDNGQAARIEDVPDGVLLLGRQGARAVNRGGRDRAGNAMPPGAGQALGALHHAALGLDHFAGGELRRVAAVRRFHLDQQRRVFQLGKQALELPGVVNVAVQLGGNVAAREYGLRRRDLV